MARLALVGVASLAVAGTRPATARAETREECVTACAERWLRNHDRVVDACARLYRNPNSFYSKPGWSRVARLLAGGGWAFVNEAVRHALWHECVENETSREVRNAHRCVTRCEQSCPASGAAATCAGTPPQTPKPPSPPPAPTTTPTRFPEPAACSSPTGLCCDCGNGLLTPVGYIPDVPCDLCKRTCVGTCS